MKAQDNTKKKPQQRNEYLVQVTIIEARNLKGQDGTGTCDPFVKITVGNLPPQVTTTKIAATTAVFNQSFTFPNLMMNSVEFESFEIKIEVMDFNQFGSNQLIGMYSIGLSTLFRNPQHEVFNTWLPITHPNEGLEPQGFLLVSAYIISPEDRPPVHDINEANVDEEPDEFGGKPDDQLTGEELQRRREKKNAIAIVGKPELRGKSYQLMINIAKAEDLPIMSFGSIDSFISVRAGGYTLITPTMKGQSKPQFATRLMFPLYFPVFNDKIVIRVWDKRICMADTFIAMIPEMPTENDFFNINFLQSRGGVMPYRWFNLYGIPTDERPSNFEELFLGYKKQMIGTDYLGRVLMSFNLTPSEKPEKMVQPLNGFREPLITVYLCRVDVYEVQEAKECGEFVEIRVKIGSINIKSAQATIKKSKGKNKGKIENKDKATDGKTYVWREKDIIIPDQKIELPSDKQQVPDIIISLYNDQKKRVAFLRIPYFSPDLHTSQPKWYSLRNVKAKLNEGSGNVTHSFLLTNIMFRPEQEIVQIPRIPVKRNIQAKYNLHAYIYAGYDFCPDCYSEEVEVYFEIKIAQYRIELDKKIQGKNPIWNTHFIEQVQVDENLEFASNIIILFQNRHPNKQGGWFSDNRLGEICIQAFKCKIDTTEQDFSMDTFQPNYKFYHVANSGSSGGRILAAFHLEKINKNQKDKNVKREQINLFKPEEFLPMVVLFPVYGVRKLGVALKSPVMNIRIPIPTFKELPFQTIPQAFEQENDKKEKNPYYNYETIKLPQTSNEQGDGSGWFGGGITDPNFLNLVKIDVFLHKSDPRFYPQLEVELRDEYNKNERFISVISLIPLAKDAKLTDLMSLNNALRFFEQGKQIEEEEEVVKVLEKAEEEEGKEEEQKDEEGNEIQNNSQTKDEKKSKKNKTTTTKQTKSENNKSEEVQQETVVKQNKQDLNFDRTIQNKLHTKNIVNVHVDDIIDIENTENDMKETKKECDWKMNKLKQLIKLLPKNTNGLELIKGHVNREIEKYKDCEVKAEKFFGLNEDDDNETFDYGRKVIKGPYEEEIADKIPFKRFPLFRLTTTKHGVIGNPTNSVIKGDIRLVRNQPKETISSTKKKQSKGTSKKSETKINSTVKQLMQSGNPQKEYKFNLFDQHFLDFFNGLYKLKVRVYILRCLNLAAQSQNIDTHHMLAGMNAICSANPYPEIIIGLGNRGSDLIKYASDQDRYIENTLSPNFFRMYELDAEIPKDWKLTLNIKNKGMVDSIIGTLEIDIEDRLVGEPKLKDRIAYTVYKQRWEQEFEKLQYKHEAEDEKVKSWLKGQITDLNQRIDSFDKSFKIPVEYKDLKNEGKNQTSQGTVEMFIEVLPIDIAREIQPSKIDKPAPQQYEVRFIILETSEIPKIPPKKVTDIFVKAAMDASATGLDKEVQKETDTHLGCDDGNGIFNWRMKFPLLLPCSFPRIKLQVYDMSTFSADDNIGEATVSLRKLLYRLRTDGNYEMPPTKIKISHPNFPDQNRGFVLVQMQIVTQQVAEAEPVGEAQDEPNINPYLEKPTVGRGLADFFKGVGGGFNFMLYLKIFAGVVVLVLLVMVLFVKPGILVN